MDSRRIDKILIFIKRLGYSLAIASLLCPKIDIANPVGGRIEAGSATISNETPNTVQVNQSSNKAVINWQSFNVGKDEQVHFQQPNSSSITLNRVNPQQGASQIYGKITANGQVWLVNPAGVWFGPSSFVNVSGILVSTANISTRDFMKGVYHFTQSPDWHGSIINLGDIVIANAGLAALIGTSVVNDGHIMADLGTIILATGKTFVIDFSGDQLIRFSISGDEELGVDQHGTKLKDAITNTGTISANGGKVLMTAHTASDILDHAINLKGIVSANSVSSHNGEIVLDGGNGNVVVDAKVYAAGKKKGETGGNVTMTGNVVALTNKTVINVSGEAGGGHVTVLKSTNDSYVGHDVSILADAITSGNGGTISLWGNKVTQAYGSFSAKGGLQSGNGGALETSGSYLDVAGISVNLTAPQGVTGTWLLDPTDVNINDNATSGIALNTGIYAPTIVGSAASTLNAGDLGTQLNSASIIVETTNASGTGNGDITLNDPSNLLQTNWGSANTTLTLQADRNITLTSALNLSGTGNGLTLTAGQTVSTGSVAINGTLDGSFSLTATSGATGTVTIGAAIGSGTALNSVNITGATNINANVSTTGAQTYNSTATLGSSAVLTGGAINLQDISLGANTLTVANSATSNIASTISGSGGALTKSGSGVLSLSVANSYTGDTTISAGTLQLGNAGAIPSGAGKGNVIDNALLDLAGFSPTLNGLSGSGTVDNVSAGGTPTLTLGGNNQTSLFSGVIQNSSGTLALTKTGTGTLSLSGTSTYDGTTTISTGVIDVKSNAALGNATGITSVASGAALQVDGSGLSIAEPLTLIGTGVSSGGALRNLANSNTWSGAVTLGSGGAQINSDAGTLTLSTGGILSGSSQPLTIGGSGNTTISGAIAASVSTLTKVDAGTLLLSATNSYTGDTTITSGTLQVGNAGAIPNGASAGNVIDNAIFDLAGFSPTINGLSGSGVVDDVSAAGTSTLTVGSNNATSLFNGTLQNTSGILALTKTGTGTLTLSGANTYDGTTLINVGVIDVKNNTALGTTTGTTSVASGAALQIDGSGLSIAEAINTLIGTGVSSGGALRNLANSNTWSGAITLGSGGAQVNSDAGTLTITGGITGTGQPLTIGGSGNTTISTIAISTGSGGALTKSGSGTLLLSIANTYTGDTTISSGTLKYGVSTAIPSGAGNGNVIDNGTLDLAGFSPTINGLSGSGIVDDVAAAGTSTITIGSNDATGAANTFSGVIKNTSGTVAVTKTGTGTLTLSGTNTYGGTTTVSTGVIDVKSNAALGNTSGTTTVASGAAIQVDGNGLSIAEIINTLIGTGVSTGGALRNLANSNTWSGAITWEAVAHKLILMQAR